VENHLEAFIFLADERRRRDLVVVEEYLVGVNGLAAYFFFILRILRPGLLQSRLMQKRERPSLGSLTCSMGVV
jgi:hypothetical protein